jgi:hypothetical protein
MSVDENKHCINCLHLFLEHAGDADVLDFHCPTGDGSWYSSVFFVPATNLEYLEKKADEALRRRS